MKITDLKCAVIGENPIVRIVTDQGIDGYGEIENTKPYVKPQVLYYRQALIGEDPTDVERCMRRIRRDAAGRPASRAGRTHPGLSRPLAAARRVAASWRPWQYCRRAS